jgi:hypothetical protein
MSGRPGHDQHDPDEAADALSAYWDALVDGATADAGGAGGLARMVDWLRGSDSTPALSSGERRRIWEGIMAAQVASSGMEQFGGRGRPGLNSKPPRFIDLPSATVATDLGRERGHAWWRGAPGALATAAMLAVVLVAALVAGPWRWRGESGEPANLPAVIVAQATPTPDAAAEETLVELAIPADLLPEGDRITSELAYLTDPPGSTGRWNGIERVDWRGLRVQHVLDGSLTMRAEDESWVARAGAGAALAEAPAGTEVVLAAGDTWLARNETPYETSNPGAEPAHLLLWVLADIADENTAFLYLEPGPWTIDFSDALPPGIEAPTEGATLRIRRLELPVEGRLPAPPGAILQHGVRPPTDAAGKPILDPSLGTLRNGTVVNLGRKPMMVYALSLEASGVEAGTPSGATPVP